MDLSFLIPSKMRRQVLEYFCLNLEAQVYVNELARILKAAPQLVYRELINMENWGFLFSSKRGNQRVFRVNRRFVLLAPLQEAVRIKMAAEQAKAEIVVRYDLNDMVKQQQRIPVPPELIPGLTSPRRRPRAWDEEVLLGKRGRDG